MAMKNEEMLMILGGAVLAALLLWLCMKDDKEPEEYMRSCLGNDCNMQRSPVDYLVDPKSNPHYQTDPTNKHQPLDQGKMDFYRDSRRQHAGLLFQEFDNNYQGCGKQKQYLVNDEKTRFELTNAGDVGARNQLDELYHERFGPRGYSHTERRYDEPRC